MGEVSSEKSITITNPLGESAYLDVPPLWITNDHFELSPDYSGCDMDIFMQKKPAAANFSCVIKYTLNPKIFTNYLLPVSVVAIKEAKFIPHPAGGGQPANDSQASDVKHSVQLFKFAASPDGATKPLETIEYKFPAAGGAITHNLKIDMATENTTYNIEHSDQDDAKLLTISETCRDDDDCYTISSEKCIMMKSGMGNNPTLTLTVPKAGCELEIKLQESSQASVMSSDTPIALYLVPSGEVGETPIQSILLRK